MCVYTVLTLDEICCRLILLIVQKWCSSRKDLRIGSLKGLETIVLPVIGASKNLISTALLAAR